MHKRGNLTLQLAKSYGFCWGVERAVQMAYEARKQFPSEKMWITNEIIHNPSVNQARAGGAARPLPASRDNPRLRGAHIAPARRAASCAHRMHA